MSDNQGIRKSHTMSDGSPAAKAMHMGSAGPNTNNIMIIQGNNNLQSSVGAQKFGRSTLSNPPGLSQDRMMDLMDEKQILQYEIEQEKDKIVEKEKKYRDEMDNLRRQHQKAIDALQTKQEDKRKYIEQEKKKLIEDKTRTIELEK